MNVLEMEEAETLIVPTKRKTLTSNNSNHSNHSLHSNRSFNNNHQGTATSLWAFVFRKDCWTYTVGVAAVTLCVLFFSSTRPTTETVDAVDMDFKSPALTSLPTTPPGSVPTDPLVSPVEVPLQTPSPTDPPASSSTSSPTSSSTSNPTSSPTTTRHDLPPGAQKDPRGAEINLYSKFSAYDPLSDPSLPDDATATQLAEHWDKWRFWDGDEDERPKDDFLAQYPNFDCPGDDFPEGAWQADAVFVNHYLDAADKLVSRAIEAIFSEYGHSREGLPPEALSARNAQFHWETCDMASATSPPDPFATKRQAKDTGGWTTKRSERGLERRLLHAMMTSDTFTVVMGGHSASAGEGNHFRQSYMMQFHQIMAPIFARLGVKLITRNFGMGGLGTLHNALGSGSIYGNEVDLLLWDSGMTEPEGPSHDVFVRQGLMGGTRVPVIWGRGISFNVLKAIHEHADADVGEWGTAMRGIPETTSEEQVHTLPWAVQYLRCTAEMADTCRREKYCTTCWQDRDDGLTPPIRQVQNPPGQVGWHPGWREHQLMGRNLAMALLRSLQTAIGTWTDNVSAGPPLADEFWHVTEYYENIRTKVRNMDKSLGECYHFERTGQLPARICNTPLKALTHYQPRSNYVGGAINSFVKPTDDGYVPRNEKKNLFDGPDPHNPCLAVPEGAVDVYAIVAGRRRLEIEQRFPSTVPVRTTTEFLDVNEVPFSRDVAEGNITSEDIIIPGKGWELWGENAGFCDGTYDAECQREGVCVLQGQEAGRGAIIGNEYSGWLVITLQGVKEGIILLKLHTWHTSDESTVTKEWTTVNNQRNLRESFLRAVERPSVSTTRIGARNDQRALKPRSTETPPLPETMAFEYAIDGKITRLPRDDFLAATKTLQRVLQVLTILDDPEFTSEPKDVEIAVRMTGCGRDCTFGVSHIYWA